MRARGWFVASALALAACGAADSTDEETAAGGAAGETAAGGGAGQTAANGAQAGEAQAGGDTQADEPSLFAPLPATQTPTPLVALGRRLFHDPRLSGDRTRSCATCHSLDHGGAEDRATSVGSGGSALGLNAPTVLNAALNSALFWDGRAQSLEEQAAEQITDPRVMGGTWRQIAERLGEDAAIMEIAQMLHGPGAMVTPELVTSAIAEYERSLITPSRFDAFLAGRTDALTEDERSGYETFVEVGCPRCHAGPNLGGASFQRLGAARDTYFEDRGTPETDADRGRFNVTRSTRDEHAFRVPTLRNVARTSPYFHDGSQGTLEDAVRAMGRYQLGDELSEGDVSSIVSFLRALTGELPPDARVSPGPPPGTTIVSMPAGGPAVAPAEQQGPRRIPAMGGAVPRGGVSDEDKAR
jgi:cytochrome c peroxidase